MKQSDILTLTDVNRQAQTESQGALKVIEMHLNAIYQLHMTMEDVDGNRIDLDLDPISQPTITPARQVKEGEDANYFTDGEPRIPKLGEIIKAFGKFTEVKSPSKTKKQIYVKSD